MRLNRDQAVQEEVRNVTRSLLETVVGIRDGTFKRPDSGLESPRHK
jgi:hypothetical protein